jgi:hypothetical protein
MSATLVRPDTRGQRRALAIPETLRPKAVSNAVAIAAATAERLSEARAAAQAARDALEQLDSERVEALAAASVAGRSAPDYGERVRAAEAQRVAADDAERVALRADQLAGEALERVVREAGSDWSVRLVEARATAARKAARVIADAAAAGDAVDQLDAVALVGGALAAGSAAAPNRGARTTAGGVVQDVLSQLATAVQEPPEPRAQTPGESYGELLNRRMQMQAQALSECPASEKADPRRQSAWIAEWMQRHNAPALPWPPPPA